jgi:uroporphyrinogen decarboxylase
MNVVGKDYVLTGNVDPIILYGSEERIRNAARHCFTQGGGKHVLNLGHGVEKDIPEENVGIFIDEAKKFRY